MKRIFAFLGALAFFHLGGVGLFAQTAAMESPAPVSLDYDINARPGAVGLRVPSAAQQEALASFRNSYGTQVHARWDEFAGSIDAVWDFRTAAYSGSAADAARAFIAENQLLFGFTDLSGLQLTKATPALGGTLVRFDQMYQGLRVRGGGIGVGVNSANQVIAAFGPTYSVSGVPTTPILSAEEAVQRARADLAPYAVDLSPEISQHLAPALDRFEASLGPFQEPSPELVVFPTADGFRLAWEFILYSRNPFGVVQYTLDADSGELLTRRDKVLAQGTSNLVGATGDIFPTHPVIDKNLQDAGIIPRDATGRPAGQLRVNLRNFDATNRTTGTAGELTGTHAHVHNTLAVKAPFLQPPLGTWHFAQDLQPVEQATREDKHFGPEAEPAEHQDEINIFFFINYLLEYITDLHIRDDQANNPLGAGDFPDSFPNKDAPLQGIVHIPCPPGVTALGCPRVGEAGSPDFVERVLGLDNAFSVPLVAKVAGQEVIVNPTAYGHGFLFNDLAIEDGVPYHEGMHSISTPIAGFEGGVESGALNEGQADLWAETISQDPSLGEYVVNGFRLRQAVREKRVFTAANGDPDLIAWIRNANSGLLYSQLCRFNRTTRAPDGRECELHQDGEIYEAAMWDVRELLQLYETGSGFVRPDLITGSPTTGILQGQETWERLFLGSLYILGIMAPDNFVRARDATILADALLYPSGLVEPGNPRQVGMHRTLIEQVFAARELGANARAPIGGRQTVSSAVSSFTAVRPAPDKPKGVKAAVFGDAVQVSWRPVTGALAYEIRKRLKGQRTGRLFPSDPLTREYFEGDASTDGSGYLDYVPGSQASFVDRGQIVGFFRARGLENPKDFQYAVRTVALNPDNTVGVSGTEFVDAAEGLETTVDTEFFTGLVPIGTAGANLVEGVDYVDIEFFGKERTLGVDASLSVQLTDLGVLPDVDFVLFEVGPDGELTQIGSSANFGPNEFISAALEPGRKYVYRVVGFANGPTLFEIRSDQYILAGTP
ncbi:MAG: M36 family metallopeptidase [Acidobacteria bacterium]|nr:M36 family metallopeptidase [Acidobacteriota bacterium]